MRVGYSFWGFLDAGIVDTPDGGRSHRRLLVDALARAVESVVFLQRNRDLAEAGQDIDGPYTWDAGLPEIDLLILEWRWEIAGRNDPPSEGRCGWTPDLARQSELLAHYTTGLGVPTAIWDKDLVLDLNSPLRSLPNVRIFEAALFPRIGATTLRFPIDTATLETVRYSQAGRPRDLVYIGNQVGRDEAFDRYFACIADMCDHAVFGKWLEVSRWPSVDFRGRIGFPDVARRYGESLATVALLPQRYEAAGQMTQRLAEATMAGCLTLVPSSVRGHNEMVPPGAVVATGDDVLDRIKELRRSRMLAEDIFVNTVHRLEKWDVGQQLDVLLCEMASVSG